MKEGILNALAIFKMILYYTTWVYNNVISIFGTIQAHRKL